MIKLYYMLQCLNNAVVNNDSESKERFDLPHNLVHYLRCQHNIDSPAQVCELLRLIM